VAAELRLHRVDRRQPAQPLFERSDLIDHIHQCVTAHGVPHRVIMLEITEDNLMKDLQNVIPSLHRLNEIGVEIAIDDFGTGYSSLAYLTTLPISELKIDRSFVRDLGISPQSSAVVTAIIALARSLGLRVIAEGVETLRQMEVLHRLGVVVMQGFLFSRPVPATDLELWLDPVGARQQRPGSARPTAPTATCRPVSGHRAPWPAHALTCTMSRRHPGADRQGRLAPPGHAQQEPTPENYARAYAEEAGQAASVLPERARPLAGPAGGPPGRRAGPPRGTGVGLHAGRAGTWSSRVSTAAAVGQRAGAGLGLAARALAAGLQRGSKQWSAARKNESLQRVLDGSRSDMQRLQQRLGALVGAWESDAPLPPKTARPAHLPDTVPVEAAAPAAAQPAPATPSDGLQDWPAVVTPLRVTINAGLPEGEPRAIELADRLAALADRLAADGTDAEGLLELDRTCAEIRRLFSHRHQLVDQLGRLCTELGQGLAELAEDDSWARGQAQSLHARLADGLNSRSVRAATEMLAETRRTTPACAASASRRATRSSS
jgi:hypothetical protein